MEAEVHRSDENDVDVISKSPIDSYFSQRLQSTAKRKHMSDAYNLSTDLLSFCANNLPLSFLTST